MATFLYWSDLPKLVEVKVIRTKRKSIELSQTAYAELNIRVPLDTSIDDIHKIIAQQVDGIKHYASITNLKKPEPEVLSEENISELKQRAKEYLPQRVHHFGDIIGVTPDSVEVTNGMKRWAKPRRN